MSWTFTKTFRYYIPTNINLENGFAFFDLDQTLITSISGKNPKYPQTGTPNISGQEDWIYLGDIITILKEIIEKDYTIIIVTNQTSISKKGGEIIQEKIENIRQDLENELGISPIILISTAKDNFKKPNIGMVTELLKILKLISLPENSFMCGDAVQKPEIVNDEFEAYKWSDADKMFAQNLGIDFYRPLDFFPSNLEIHQISSNLNDITEIIASYDIVILTGMPGVGKSTLANTLIELDSERIYLESDKYKSNFKTMQNAYIKKLKEGKTKFVIEAMNATNEKRNLWIEPALNKSNTLSILIVWFIRNGRPWNALRDDSVPEKAYTMHYVNKFEIPIETDNINVIRVY